VKGLISSHASAKGQSTLIWNWRQYSKLIFLGRGGRRENICIYNSWLCFQCSAEFDSTWYCNVLPHNERLLQSVISQAGNNCGTLLTTLYLQGQPTYHYSWKSYTLLQKYKTYTTKLMPHSTVWFSMQYKCHSQLSLYHKCNNVFTLQIIFDSIGRTRVVQTV